MVVSKRDFVRAAVGLVSLVLVGGTASTARAQNRLRGIDVASYQHPGGAAINWKSIQAAGDSFAFIKATEGTGYTNPYFARDWGKAKANHPLRGAYHFGHPGIDAVAQARHFLNVVRPTRGDLQMMLDLEVTDGRSPAQVWAWTQAFIGEVQRQTGRPGIIYTGFYFWRDRVGNPANNLNCPLFLA